MSETPGRILSAARESKSLSPADIAKQTRLSIQAIQDIESDSYERFGSSTFVRGYLRSYARAVDVSEESILIAWEKSDVAAKLLPPAPSVVEGISAAQSASHEIQTSTPSPAVMVIGALVVLSALALWENQKTPPVINSAELAPKTVAIMPATPPVAAPVQVAAKTQVQADVVKTAAKKIKHTVVAHHHAEPMHVTYTVRPVSESELVDH